MHKNNQAQDENIKTLLTLCPINLLHYFQYLVYGTENVKANLRNHINLNHDNKITLLTPWANALYNHEVKGNTTNGGFNYTIVCFLELCNEDYIPGAKPTGRRSNSLLAYKRSISY